MNYLAHAFLSFNDSEIQFGNMIGDFVKGKQIENYPTEIQQGIKLHKAIDLFTDQHPIVDKAVAIFHQEFKLSSAIFTDIVFDNFLANDSRYFTDTKLDVFTHLVYENLRNYNHLMNEKMLHFFSHMDQYNWLYQYRTIEGISKSIHGICKRYPKLGNPEKAMQLFENNYEELNEYFKLFFPELMDFSQQKINELKQHG